MEDWFKEGASSFYTGWKPVMKQRKQVMSQKKNIHFSACEYVAHSGWIWDCLIFELNNRSQTSSAHQLYQLVTDCI